MRKHSLSIYGIALMLVACASKNNNEKMVSAEEYDDLITSRITKMQQSLLAVQNVQFDSTLIDSVIKRYENQVDSVNTTIKAMPGFEGSNAYRNAAVQLGAFYKKAVGTYYADIAKIYKNKKDTAVDTKADAIVAKITEEESKMDDVFIKERGAFAKKYKLDVDNLK